jgi:hypothetical protein
VKEPGLAMTSTSSASLLAVVAIAIGTATIAEAQSLEGLWEFSWQAPDGTYTGTMAIDSYGQARLVGTSAQQDFSQCGHVKTTAEKVELIFTTASAGYNPDHFQCTAPTDLTLTCTIEDSVGKAGTGTFARIRSGNAPAKQASRLRSLECTAPQVSRSGNGLKMGAGPLTDFDRKRTVEAGENKNAGHAERA